MLQPLPWAPVMLASEHYCFSQVALVKGKEKKQQEACESSSGDTAHIVSNSPVHVCPPPSGVHLLREHKYSDSSQPPFPAKGDRVFISMAGRRAMGKPPSCGVSFNQVTFVNIPTRRTLEFVNIPAQRTLEYCT